MRSSWSPLVAGIDTSSIRYILHPPVKSSHPGLAPQKGKCPAHFSISPFFGAKMGCELLTVDCRFKNLSILTKSLIFQAVLLFVKLCSFSVGEGSRRRPVVCFAAKFKNGQENGHSNSENSRRRPNYPPTSSRNSFRD